MEALPVPTPRKPAERRQRRNKPPAVVGLPSRKTECPPAPRGLLTQWANAWAAYWDSPLAGAVAETDIPALKRLFEMRDLRTRFDILCKKQLFLDGSQGQPVLNPLLRQIAQLDSSILQLEDRFGLTPKARGVVGAQVGPQQTTLDDLNADLYDPTGRNDRDPRYDRDAR
jgi:hypothetical protein